MREETTGVTGVTPCWLWRLRISLCFVIITSSHRSREFSKSAFSRGDFLSLLSRHEKRSPTECDYREGIALTVALPVVRHETENLESIYASTPYVFTALKHACDQRKTLCFSCRQCRLLIGRGQTQTQLSWGSENKTQVHFCPPSSASGMLNNGGMF